jgi:hypothetical protein
VDLALDSQHIVDLALDSQHIVDLALDSHITRRYCCITVLLHKGHFLNLCGLDN